MSAPTVQTRTQTKIKITEPPMYKVIYVNDDQTSMQFVVDSLMDYFQYTQNSAEQITLDIHNEGAAVVATMPYEMAEQKGIEVTVDARSNGYPLQIRIEAEAD
jgi:ATP-dependent Clp protease adaptor protein ClpS